ncbi:MAG: hypothetical protein IPP83_07625 [Flavobacteriales bacterium]|nr:hypothetical protein [Flavobacteriales bacterium]
MTRSLFFFVCAALLMACRTDEPVKPRTAASTLRIEVRPEWNGQPLQRYTPYIAPHGYRFQVEFLKMYLSDLRLVSATGESAVEQVRLLDLGNGPFQFDLQVPVGNWLGLRAGIGLPHDLNYTNAALYGDEHPMSVNNGMYWSWATGYKFVLFDGRYDPDPNGTGPLLSTFSVHTGMDTCFTTAELFPALPFGTEKDVTTKLVLRIAVDHFLATPQDTINVTTENQSHGGNYPLALKLTRNVRRSMALEVL